MPKREKTSIDKMSKYIIHIGMNGFPFGTAAVNHSIFICKAMQVKGQHILLLNNKAVHNRNIPVSLSRWGETEGMIYHYTTFSPYRSKNFIVRNTEKVIGVLNEILFIIKLKITGQLKAALLYLPNNSFGGLVYYRFLSKLLCFPIVLNQTEYFSGFDEKKKYLKRASDKYFDKYSYYFADGYLLISDYIRLKVFFGRKEKPFVKVPPLVDVELFSNLSKEKHQTFVFCASTAYLEVIFFAIDAFEKVENLSYRLILIVNGDQLVINKLMQRIKISEKAALIDLFSNLKYLDLLSHYYNAAALLIPLRPTIQDSARFPQKISEYLASGNPIITTNIGEVKNYFIDRENALIAEEYNVELFAQKMNFVINNPKEAEKIGLLGKKIAMKLFHYRSYSDKLLELFNKI